MKIILGTAFLSLVITMQSGASQNVGSFLQMYVDELPQMPKIYGYSLQDGSPKPTSLTIGMYAKKWRFHRDLPDTTVFVYGTSAATATFPGPTIEALQGVPLSVTWENHLPHAHILPWDPTVLTAIPKYGGVPAVVHLHGGIHEPQSDGSPLAWFSADFRERGPEWTKTTYYYANDQHPGNHWYHDHALGLTRVNLLAGLIGSYILRNPFVEGPFGLPCGDEFDRMLVIVDRSFNRDGSIYMNATGVDTSVHPHWQPEYFGDAIIVNGKAWPYLRVQRRKYRFRIINSSNARYLHLSLSNGLQFTVVGSDSSYLPAPVTTPTVLLSPAEIFDVVVDFSRSGPGEIEMTNDAPYPYPAGTPANFPNSKVMRFIVAPGSPNPPDDSKIPSTLVNYPAASASDAVVKRYITLYEYSGSSGKTTHLYINGKRLLDPATETPRVGSSEIWEVINLTGDDHPLHLHLAEFQAIAGRGLANATAFKNCMKRLNDAVKCNIAGQATGSVLSVPDYERTWKNVVKIPPGNMTTVVVKFHPVDSNKPYPFDATARPGYVYHCHILDHEDNEMIRPLKLIP